MIALIQRVRRAEVSVAGVSVGQIGTGLVALVCAERGDDESSCHALVDKLLGYRVFADEAQRMNRSLADTGGGLLVVPQFTLAADTHSGTRPSFTPAADAVLALRLFDAFLARARALHPTVESGRFGSEMDVELVNHGPVTFWLRVAPRAAQGT